MTSLDLDIKNGISTESGVFKWLDIGRVARVLQKAFQHKNNDLKPLNYLSDEQLADLGLNRAGLAEIFKKSTTAQSDLNHLKRGIYVNGRQWD